MSHPNCKATRLVSSRRRHKEESPVDETFCLQNSVISKRGRSSALLGVANTEIATIPMATALALIIPTPRLFTKVHKQKPQSFIILLGEIMANHVHDNHILLDWHRKVFRATLWNEAVRRIQIVIVATLSTVCANSCRSAFGQNLRLRCIMRTVFLLRREHIVSIGVEHGF
jgi:hypothetical protein